MEKDATANVTIEEAYSRAAQRYGSREWGAERLEDDCMELERLALDRNRRAACMRLVTAVVDELWLNGDEQPDLEDFARTMVKISQRAGERHRLVRCAAHGWQEPHLYGTCLECPCLVPSYYSRAGREPGRTREYCSNACRQRAYRRRRAAERTTASPIDVGSLPNL
ncbi:hypothetical protein AB0H71_16985 [Nocardia sp. NPDC050697]|uniref:hypothetical protein n=1 Tax=Nocardia sp. NPDC050697 TaxID=3155158 RepID=UPI0033CA6131